MKCKAVDECDNSQCIHAYEHDKRDDCTYGYCIFAHEGVCKCH